MQTPEKNYSNYLGFLSNLTRIGSLLAGFTFTVFTLLIALLPPNFIAENLLAQITMFFLAFLFNFLVFLAAWGSWYMLYFCEWVAPMTRESLIVTLLSFASYCFFGIAILLMFLLLNLVVLFIAATVMWVIFVVLIMVFIYRPLRKFQETRDRVRGISPKKAEKRKAEQK